MSRGGGRIPGVTVHRWNRPPLSCQRCRQMKRRCDRHQPCSSCRQRDVLCEYERDDEKASLGAVVNGEDAIFRIQRLEDAVFPNGHAISVGSEQSQQVHGAAAPSPACSAMPHERTSQTGTTTPFGVNLLAPDPPFNIGSVLAHLPPRHQGMELCNHFARTVQQTTCIFHMPSTRAVVEKAYDAVSRGNSPAPEDVLTLFVVFAGAAHSSTPDILQQLGTTEDGARASFALYTRLAMQMVAHPPLAPTTVCLAAMATLLHLLISVDGISMSVHLLRSRLIVMLRVVQLHKLDAPRSVRVSDIVEVEVQRRIWWDTVSTDWLSSFSGNPFEGAYIFHPRNMAVNYPGNIDDGDLNPSTEESDLNAPLDTPTGMSVFMQRLKLADLCREAIDTLPSILLEQEEASYSSILALDAKFQAYIDNLPVFFRLDELSMQETENICIARPMIRHQRIAANLGIHVRVYRLHLPYYLRGRTDPIYAHSNAACITSAQKVLELRRKMDDDITQSAGTRPARLWKVAQHVFSAALVLAADVALDPVGLDATAKREQVLEACRTLEESMKESTALREGVQRNIQTLMTTLRGDSGEGWGFPEERNVRVEDGPSVERTLQKTTVADWDALWAEFIGVVPDLDVQGWDALLGNIDFGLPGYGT